MSVDHIDEIVSKLQYKQYDLVKYYTKNIQYHIDADKLKAMHLFLDKIKLLERVGQV